MMLSKKNIRSLYVNGTTLYAACQDKKLFKIDLPKLEIVELQKNVHKKMFDCVGLYDEMLVTVSYPCIEGDKLYIASRNIYGIGIVYLNEI